MIAMKKIIIIVLAVLSCVAMQAQKQKGQDVVIANEDSCDIASIQSAVDACILLADASFTGDSLALLQAEKAMKECNLSDFATLRPEKKNDAGSLQGHLVFHADFARELAEGKDPYADADSFSKRIPHRGQMSQGQILTKTFLVKAKGKSTYSFPSRDRQELAVVAEPGGRVSTRIHVTNPSKGIDEWHNDTAEVAKGRSNRKTSFTLPSTPPSNVTLEISNCTDKDISVVVISN